MLTPCQKQIKHRDRLFYDTYQYCLSFKQKELYCIRGLQASEKINHYIKQRQRYETAGIGHQSQQTRFTLEVVENLHRTQALLAQHPEPLKFVVSGEYGALYTNDMSIVDQVCKLEHVVVSSFRTAQVTIPRDTVMIRSPKFQYRTYFREREVFADKKASLIAWVNAQQDEIGLSPATRHWLSSPPRPWRRSWMQRYYYIEHNNLHYETMLSLIMPGHVRKTVPVISSDK